MSDEAEQDAKLKEWIAYADRLEKVIELVTGSSVDSLKRMQAEKGLRLVHSSRPRS